MGKASAKKKAKKWDYEFVEHILTNNPEKYQRLEMMFKMYYTGAFENTIGIMEAVDKETGRESVLLVGLTFNEVNGEKVIADCYPLARVLDKDEVSNYLGPDGRGGYWGQEAHVSVD